MFIRFVTLYTDPESQVTAGIFAAAYTLRRAWDLPDCQWEELDDLLFWFGKNLDVPTRFSRSRRPFAQSKAICWFKPTAREHLEAIRRMAWIVEENGIVIKAIKTVTPGYIVYEDDYQIAAEPFYDIRRRL